MTKLKIVMTLEAGAPGLATDSRPWLTSAEKQKLYLLPAAARQPDLTAVHRNVV
ncbi:hypothetical protein N9H39_01655 [Gammaproteobacteria bacterium]|nr:hypothetical protein [Gammaproteobacteria bacterium]